MKQVIFAKGIAFHNFLDRHELTNTFSCIHMTKGVKRIGAGPFSTVYANYDDFWCVKRVSLLRSDGRKAVARELMALRVLERSNSPNIIRILGADLCGDQLNIRIELMDFSLDDLILSYDSCMTDSVIIKISIEISKGILACHAAGMIHRDVKPSNILLSHRGGVKLCDFGLAKAVGKTSSTNLEFTNEVCTRWYKPIEILLGQDGSPQSYAIDIWSFGCVVAELCLLSPLFQGWSDMDQLIRIKSTLEGVGLRSAVPHASEKVLKLIENCLRYNPSDRPSATYCRDYLAGISGEEVAMLGSVLCELMKQSSLNR